MNVLALALFLAIVTALAEALIGNGREVTRLMLATLASMPVHETGTLLGEYASKSDLLS